MYMPLNLTILITLLTVLQNDRPGAKNTASFNTASFDRNADLPS